MSSKISEENDDEKDIEIMSRSEEDQEAEFGTFDLEDTHELDASSRLGRLITARASSANAAGLTMDSPAGAAPRMEASTQVWRVGADLRDHRVRALARARTR